MKEVHQLFESFSKPAKPDWTKAASAEISGANPEETLRWTTPDQQEFAPYYSAVDVESIAYLQKFQLTGVPHNAPDARMWANMPEVVVDDEQVSNNTALEHLKLEAEGILFTTEGKGLNFAKLLTDIQWEHCAVSFLADAQFPLTNLINYISDKNYKYDKLQGNIFWRDRVVLPPALPSHNGFRFAGIRIEANSPVREVAEALVRGASAIEAFVAAGHKINEAARHVAFCMPLSTQLLLDIGKLKALRMLWYQVVRAYGANAFTPADLYLHGYSDKWISEKFQPHGNMLKSTVAAIAAISGGVNGLTIIPEENQHSMMNRIARNTSVILKAESQLARVNDPFAGAYSVEVMTDRIARDAWVEFQAKQ